jgi:hypothetical protein
MVCQFPQPCGLAIVHTVVQKNDIQIYHAYRKNHPLLQDIIGKMFRRLGWRAGQFE